MNLVPEFNEAIKKYRGSIDDESVFELVSAKFHEMCDNGTAYRTATNVVKKISKDVKGDPSAWKTGGADLDALKPNTENAFLYDICVKIKPSTICLIGLVPEFNQIIKEHADKELDDRMIYELLLKKYREMRENGQDNWDAGRAIRRVSRDVTGDSHTWEQD